MTSWSHHFTSLYLGKLEQPYWQDDKCVETVNTVGQPRNPKKTHPTDASAVSAVSSHPWGGSSVKILKMDDFTRFYQTYHPSHTGWWFETCFIFPYIGLGRIIPTDELIFFRGVAQSPTSIRWPNVDGWFSKLMIYSMIYSLIYSLIYSMIYSIQHQPSLDIFGSGAPCLTHRTSQAVPRAHLLRLSDVWAGADRSERCRRLGDRAMGCGGHGPLWIWWILPTPDWKNNGLLIRRVLLQ